MNLRIPETSQKRVVIIGAGFAGMNLALKLSKSDYQVVLIDKHNYHTFQPLLYQVATGGLDATSIAYPLRKLLRKASNIYFRLAEVSNIDTDQKYLETDIGKIKYDILTIAIGSTTNFFNLPESSTSKMKSLKSIAEALDLRSFIIENFEQVLLEKEEDKKQSLMTVSIVGGGPTGVELAGAIGEMKRRMLPKDYPELDFDKMEVHLYEAMGSLLGPMSKKSQQRAEKYLKGFDVHVHLNTAVESYKNNVLTLANGEQLLTDTVIWTAGVKGAAINGLPASSFFPNGRIKVNTFNEIEGVKDAYAIGDIACMSTPEEPRGHPMVAPAAIQQGELLAKNLINIEKGKAAQPFKYLDKGSMATVGRDKAVVDFPGEKITIGGFFAWVTWMFVHLMSLVGFRNKLLVFTGWVYNYLNYDSVLRLIIRPTKATKAEDETVEEFL